MDATTKGHLAAIVLNVDDYLASFDQDFTPEARAAADALYDEARTLGVMPREPRRAKVSWPEPAPLPADYWETAE